MTTCHTEIAREAVGIFHDERSLNSAILELETCGFDRADISLLAAVPAVEKTLGHTFQSVADLEEDPEVPTLAYVSPASLGDSQGALIGGLLYIGALASLVPIVASGGTLAAAMVAAAVGGSMGGVAGAALAGLVSDRHAKYIEAQLERGGLLLWVRVWNEGDERRAISILKAHSADHVHVFAFAVDREKEGDTRADPPASTHSYRGERYTVLPGGAAYAAGQIYLNEELARRALDRRVTLEALFAEMEPTGISIAEALADPTLAFASPSDLLRSAFSDPLKLELLKRWKYDVGRLDAATDEGMPAARSGEVKLEDIDAAMRMISAPV